MPRLFNGGLMSPFESYKMFLAIKMHFTTPGYDYIKYQGKVGAKIESFERRRDKFQFAKLAKKKDPLYFLVSNFVYDSPTWIGDLLTEEAENNFAEWQKKQQSLTYILTNEINMLDDDFVSYFKVKDGQHPLLLNMYKQKKLSIETLIVLNDILTFFPIWDKKLNDTIIWPSIRDKCLKYRQFIHYDKAKLKQVVKSMMTESVL
jgi:hypothetical protein